MNQDIHIRKEETFDYKEVIELTVKAFKNMPYADGDKDKLVERLREAPTFIRELSLVAEPGGKILGHILFPPAIIDNEQKQFQTLVL